MPELRQVTRRDYRRQILIHLALGEARAVVEAAERERSWFATIANQLADPDRIPNHDQTLITHPRNGPEGRGTPIRRTESGDRRPGEELPALGCKGADYGRESGPGHRSRGPTGSSSRTEDVSCGPQSGVSADEEVLGGKAEGEVERDRVSSGSGT